MVDEIARLGVAVDSTTAVSAQKDLEALAASGDKATSSTRKLNDSWQNAAFSSSKLLTANRSLKNFRTQIGEASKASSDLDQTWKSNTFSPTRLMSLNQDLRKFQQANMEAAKAAALVDQEWKKNTFNNGQLMKANQSLINFRRAQQDAATTASRASAQIATANKVQAESHHQVAKAAVGYTKSAKEMAFATRNLPAQFTDIAVSLQAGQNPLTVLLQQGGQLKDMFGGVGPAIKAMGGYIWGLVNPYTLAAAAVAALGIAWVKGDAEARKLSKTLELQGNTLGVTTGDLLSAASGMERFGQSQGAATAALNATAASGKIFGDSIETVAQAALNLEREGGQAIEKTVEQFSSLVGEPTAAALKLDEQFKFLTVSTYEQIRALEEQGDTMGAARVAMDSLADTINTRTANIEENLGTLEKTWRLVANSAKWAWDQMLNIGRESSVEDKIIALNDKIREVNNPSNFFSYSHLGPKGSDSRSAFVKNLQEEIRGLQKIRNAEAAKAEQEFIREQGRVAAISLAELARQGQTNAQKRVAERAKIEADAARAVSGIVAKNSADRIAQERAIRQNEAAAIAQMEKRLADPKTPKAKKSDAARDAERELRQRAQEYAGLDQALERHEATLNAAGEAQDRLSSFERYAVKTLADLEGKHSHLDAAQKAEIKTRIEALRVIDQANAAREKENRILEVSADLSRKLAEAEAAQTRGHNRELVGVGRGRNEGALEMALGDIRHGAMQERMDLEEKYQDLRAEGSAAHLADLAKINEAEARMSAAEIAQYERRKAAMADWRNGARAAMEDIAYESGDWAGQTKDAFTNIWGAMQSSVDNFTRTGKFKIRDFATTVIAELTRIALTIAVSKILSSMFASAGGGGGGGGGMPTAGPIMANGGVFSGGGVVPFAKGGVTPFAMGGVNGTVFTGATLLPMANGSTALVAEERPEAVLPLQRGPNGKLGVAAQGGGGSVFNLTTNVMIDNNGGVRSDTEATGGSDSQDAKRLGEMINQRVRDVLVQERRQGGILWQMANGR